MDKEKLYFVMMWPDTQELFDLDGFDENCYLINDDKGMDNFGSSAYFVNLAWYESVRS